MLVSFLWRSLAAAYGRFEAAAQLAVSYAFFCGYRRLQPIELHIRDRQTQESRRS